MSPRVLFDKIVKTAWTLLGKVAALLRPWFWQAIVVVLAIGFILTVVRPFAPSVRMTPDTVALAWNESISLLGINPVYPPTEDLHVGDLWGIIDETDDVGLLSKGVRIGYIDLRNEITAGAKGPIFAATSELKQGETFRHQEGGEVNQTQDCRRPCQSWPHRQHRPPL
jgi:hypothetical protein